MGKKRLISKKVEDFYNQVSEESRLKAGLGTLEFNRNKELIGKFLTSSKLRVIDVGGGTGKYAEWLAKKGHEIYLVDPIPKHIKQAQKKAGKLDNTFTVSLGEARTLDFSDNFADLILLHGPLYHLQKKEERKQAIKEAKRVLKKDGIILGFAINYTASTFAGLLQGLIHNESFFSMCKDELSTGIHNPPGDFPWLLAEAYYHKPEELKKEFLSLELEYINTFAVEGIAWLDKEYFVSMADEAKRKVLYELIHITENDPNLLALSPHIMIAVRK